MLTTKTRPAASLLLVALLLCLATPALAGSMGPSLQGKAKLKLQGAGKNKELVALSHRQIDGPTVGSAGQFAIEGPFAVRGGTQGRGAKRQLLLEAASVPGVEDFLAAQVADMLEVGGRESEVDALALKRAMVELSDAKADSELLEQQIARHRRELRRIEALVEAGVVPPSDRERKLAEVARVERMLEIQRKTIMGLEREIETLRSGVPRPADVTVVITRADLRSKLEKRATRMSVSIKIQFDAIVEATGERLRGSYKAKAKGAAFDIVQDEAPAGSGGPMESIEDAIERLR